MPSYAEVRAANLEANRRAQEHLIANGPAAPPARTPARAVSAAQPARRASARSPVRGVPHPPTRVVASVAPIAPVAIPVYSAGSLAPHPQPRPQPTVHEYLLDEDQLKVVMDMLEQASLAAIDEEQGAIKEEEDSDASLVYASSEGEGCEWPSSSDTSSTLPDLISIHEESMDIEEEEHQGQTFRFPPSAAEMDAYNIRHDPSFRHHAALSPLHDCLAWLFPSEVITGSSLPLEHPSTTDLRTGASSIKDCLSWLCPAKHEYSLPPYGLAVFPEREKKLDQSDLKTGYASPSWSLEWLTAAHEQREKVTSLGAWSAVWSDEWQQYQWVHDAVSVGYHSVAEEQQEENQEEGQQGLYHLPLDEEHVLLQGRKLAVSQLELMAQEWWTTADDLYLQDEGLSLSAARELSEFCSEEANRIQGAVIILRAFQDAGIPFEQIPEALLSKLAGGEAVFGPSERLWA